MIRVSGSFILAIFVVATTVPKMTIAQDTQQADDPVKTAVTKTLTGFHVAASEADGKKYFDYFTPDAIFLGTDASERWNIKQFKEYAMPYFNDGKGWTYVASERHVYLAPDKNVAWFDERLQNEKYGEVRGTGVLQKKGDRWLISQYNLSFPVPNELTGDLVEKIRALSK